VTAVAVTPRHSFGVMRNRDYAVFWVAALVSNSGTWMQTIAVPFVLFELTHSTTWLGVGAFMAFFPALAIGPVAGSLADRFPRKHILLATQTALMVFAFGLWGVWVAGLATPGVIVAIVFVSGLATGVNIAAWQSFVPQLVPARELLDAVRLNSMQFVGARAFGPALAGLVLQAWGAGACFLLNAVTYVLVVVALLAIHPRAVARDQTAGRVWEHFREALRYVRARRSLLYPVVTITAVSFFASSVVQLAPAFAREFSVGRGAYGLLVAMFGGGAILGSVVVGGWGNRARRSVVVAGGIVLIVLGQALLAVAPGYALGLTGMFTMGAAYLLIATALNTSIQGRVDETHRGRAMSIYLMGLLAGVPLGALLQGKLASIVGLRETVLGAAVILLALTLAVLLTRDGFRPLDEEIVDEPGTDLLLSTPPAVASAD
jgi:MFS family permease